MIDNFYEFRWVTIAITCYLSCKKFASFDTHLIRDN